MRAQPRRAGNLRVVRERHRRQQRDAWGACAVLAHALDRYDIFCLGSETPCQLVDRCTPPADVHRHPRVVGYGGDEGVGCVRELLRKAHIPTGDHADILVQEQGERIHVPCSSDDHRHLDPELVVLEQFRAHLAQAPPRVQEVRRLPPDDPSNSFPLIKPHSGRQVGRQLLLVNPEFRPNNVAVLVGEHLLAVRVFLLNGGHLGAEALPIGHHTRRWNDTCLFGGFHLHHYLQICFDAECGRR
mmetsp:Transcript_86984/g.251255  ORF Transcript_86984/g.251255 Transcript_86984/m.251255 type:complete len:243 (-) Transcript_86984:1000-1728(-)